MAATPKRSAKNKKSSSRTKSGRRPTQKSDHLAWFERARVMHGYSESLKQADAKAFNLFEIVAEQMQNQFKWNAFLFALIMFVSVVLIALGLITLFIIPNPNETLEKFSSVGIPVGVFSLLFILFRNPIIQTRHLLESVLKLNVIFVGFIRRVRHSDMLLQSMLNEKDSIDLDKLYLLMQEFQGIVDQTQQEISQINQI